MITIEQVIAVLFKVLLLVVSNPNIPQDVKDNVVSAVMVTLAQEASVNTAPVVTSSPVVSPQISSSVNTSSAVPAVPVTVVDAVPVVYIQAEIYIKSRNVIDFKMNDADRAEYVVSWVTKRWSVGYAIPVGGDNTIKVDDGMSGLLEVVSFKNGIEIGRFTKDISATNGVEIK